MIVNSAWALLRIVSAVSRWPGSSGGSTPAAALGESLNGSERR
jgi:hypothetical protein